MNVSLVICCSFCIVSIVTNIIEFSIIILMMLEIFIEKEDAIPMCRITNIKSKSPIVYIKASVFDTATFVLLAAKERTIAEGEMLPIIFNFKCQTIDLRVIIMTNIFIDIAMIFIVLPLLFSAVEYELLLERAVDYGIDRIMGAYAAVENREYRVYMVNKWYELIPRRKYKRLEVEDLEDFKVRKCLIDKRNKEAIIYLDELYI